MTGAAKRRWIVLALALVVAALFGWAAQEDTAVRAPASTENEKWIDPGQDPQRHAHQARRVEIDRRFQQAIAMLHAKKYEHAVTALHRVLELEPRLPEAHVNMGFALIGLGRYAAARDFFRNAIDLRPEQANAYYGLALALEKQNDRHGAIGAMRAYIHLTTRDDPFVRKARAALWEWEAASKRSADKKNARRKKYTASARP